MVHLSAIHHDAKGDSQSVVSTAAAGSAAVAAAVDKLETHDMLRLSNEGDEFTTSVYGSHFVGEDLPKSKMPESQMPLDVAYRMIRDHLSLDNNPMLK